MVEKSWLGSDRSQNMIKVLWKAIPKLTAFNNDKVSLAATDNIGGLWALQCCTGTQL